jgi:hypothetical protein
MCVSSQDFLPFTSEYSPGLQSAVYDLAGERVRVVLTPSIRGESLECLANYDRVLLANSLRQRGLTHEYKITGKGTPLVVYAKNPNRTLQEKHYSSTGISLGLTAVKEERLGEVPLLKLYDAFDRTVVRSSSGPEPIAANYTATLAVLDSYARPVAGSAAGSFLRPDNPRFATGVYLIHPYEPNKIPILFVHGLISSPLAWNQFVLTSTESVVGSYGCLTDPSPIS